MSAQTPQTDEHIWKPPYRYDRYDDCFRDAENWGIPIPVLMELFTNALAESNRLRALCEELREALEDVRKRSIRIREQKAIVGIEATFIERVAQDALKKAEKDI